MLFISSIISLICTAYWEFTPIPIPTILTNYCDIRNSESIIDTVEENTNSKVSSYNVMHLWHTSHSALPPGHPQYGFAHRVNNPDNIDDVLIAGANGIEIDICNGYSIWSGRNWYVSHNDGNVCNCFGCKKLTQWLSKLKSFLANNPSRHNQLAMLWIDIKEPGDKRMSEVPDIVHSAGLPPDIEILYDLTGFNEKSKGGFKEIVNKLNCNEGVSFCAGRSCGGDFKTVQNIYDYYKSFGFKRGTFNTGDSLNIDESIVDYAKSDLFSNISDPYRFKLVLTWTNARKSSITDHTDPNSHYTDGQIYGNAVDEWNDDEKYIKLFRDSVNAFSDQDRMATAADDPFECNIVSAANTNQNESNQTLSNLLETNNDKIFQMIDSKQYFYQIMFVLSFVIILLVGYICFCGYKSLKISSNYRQIQPFQVKIDKQ